MLNKKKKLRQLVNPRWTYLLRRSLHPLSPKYGMERGTPIDRYYIEKFLHENRDAIRGTVMEIRDHRYATTFENIEKIDVVDIDRTNKSATIHDDLRTMESVNNDTYDCLIITQTLQYIDDLDAAMATCHRILKPGGVLLATVPSMSRVDPHDKEYWRFTRDAVKLIAQNFSRAEVTEYGNILTGIGFWIGQAAEEFSEKELSYQDSSFPVLISLAAKK